MQHERAPRPLPLFLELMREVSESDPRAGADALAGLRAYERAPRRERPPAKPEIARVRGACLRDHGGDGPPVVLVPSLINPPDILDLDEQVSLDGRDRRHGRADTCCSIGARRTSVRAEVAGHVEELLLPLLRSIGEPAALVGYCLGGTMAIAAANLSRSSASRLSPRRGISRAIPNARARALQDMWRHSQAAAASLGALPMEVLQAAFWSLDPERTVSKFAEFGRLDPASPEAQRFVALEDWANEGEPLPFSAAQELIEDLFGCDVAGTGAWPSLGRTMSDALDVPALHLTAERDLIAPPQTAACGDVVAIPSGHVGMIVGSARTRLHAELRRFLGQPD